jgi:LysM repeat protein
MKQIIPLKKDLYFNSNISEITSISLEHNLQLGDRGLISGEININGEYKQNDLNINVEDFNHNIPFEIALADDYDLSNIKIDIDDFYYEIVNNNILRVNVDIAINGLEKNMELLEQRSYEDLVENITLEEQTEDIDEITSNITLEEVKEYSNPNVRINNSKDLFKETSEEIKSIFNDIDDNAESFAMYHVYIVKEEDTIETIMLKYNQTKDDLLKYNDLGDFKIGAKIIVPANKNNE